MLSRRLDLTQRVNAVQPAHLNGTAPGWNGATSLAAGLVAAPSREALDDPRQLLRLGSTRENICKHLGLLQREVRPYLRLGR
jgi:hypothetical protein